MSSSYVLEENAGFILRQVTQRHLSIFSDMMRDGLTQTQFSALIRDGVSHRKAEDEWRLWNGKAKDAQISLDRIHAVMHHFRGQPEGHRSIAPSRKL